MAFSEGERYVEKSLRDDWCTLLDSGAFANFTRGKQFVTVEDYADYLRRRGHLFWRYFNLDVIGDAEGSERNIRFLRENGLNPIPIFQRGGTSEQLQDMLEHNDLVGIGGVAGRLNKKEDAAYFDQVMQIVGKRSVHVLGCGSEKILARYRPFSADSSSFVLRNGTLIIWFEERLFKLQLKEQLLLNGKPASSNKVLLARICDEFSIRSSDLWTQTFYGKDPARIVGYRSAIRYQRHLQTRYNIKHFIAAQDDDRRLVSIAWDKENT